MIPRQDVYGKEGSGRALQRNRTRRDLLAAARELVSEGLAPGVADAADRAGVSRTTAYRYFASQHSLLAEAAVEPLNAAVAEIIANCTRHDVIERVDDVFRRATPLMLERETQLAMMLGVTLGRSLGENLAGNAPLLSTSWIDAFGGVLEPLRDSIDSRTYVLMTRSLSVLLGTEALMTIKDACDGDPERTTRAVRAAATAMAQGFLERIP